MRSRRLELPRVAPQRPQRCASTNSATTALFSRALTRARDIAKEIAALNHASRKFAVKCGGDKARHNGYPMGMNGQDLHNTRAPATWVVAQDRVDYEDAVAAMHARVAAIYDGTASECVWLLEHPPLFTAGVSAKPNDLRAPDMFPVYKSERGGEYTYHGPGQRVAYLMLDLRTRGRDLRAFVRDVEQWVIDTLAAFNVKGERREGRVGVWVDRTRPGGPLREDKIAAIGIRVRRWVSFHGVSINVEPELDHFGGIVPCGISDQGLGVTSLVDLGLPITMDDFDMAMLDAYHKIFGPTVPTSAHRP